MKIGVVGAGSWGKNLIKNFKELGVLHAVVDNNPQIRNSMATAYPDILIYDSYSDFLSKSQIDAVAIATPVATHAELTLSALRSGKHVFVEKPMSLNTKDAQTMVQTAKDEKKILMAGHLLLFQPAIRWIKDFLTAGNLGQVFSIHQSRCNLGRVRKVENVLWSFGVHDVAVLFYLCGSKCLNVKAVGQRVLQSEIEDDVYVHFEFENKVQAHLHNSWLWPLKERHLTVIGSQGMLTYDEVSQNVTLHHKSVDSHLQHSDKGSEVIYEGHGEPLRLELEHFLNSIQENSEPISSGLCGLEVIDALEKASLQLERQ